MTTIPFEFDTEHGKFADALVFLDEVPSDEEIEAMRAKEAKLYGTRLRVGGKYYTTPFNAFSEHGLTSAGFNPDLAAAGEAADATDQYGRELSGSEASIVRRLTTKFPQAELGYKRYKGWRVDKGLDKPSQKYIGEKGSEGYGLTKEKQGYDPSKPNYVESMDPRKKTKNDVGSFLGVPRIPLCQVITLGLPPVWDCSSFLPIRTSEASSASSFCFWRGDIAISFGSPPASTIAKICVSIAESVNAPATFETFVVTNCGRPPIV